MSQALYLSKLRAPLLKKEYGAVARDRTVDLVINSHTLYLLSYNGLRKKQKNDTY